MDSYTTTATVCSDCGGSYLYPAHTYRREMGAFYNDHTIRISRCPHCRIQVGEYRFSGTAPDLERQFPD